jgi:hypothetical protein
MQFGDTIRLEMADAGGKSIFGAIDQKLVQYVAQRCAYPHWSRTLVANVCSER